MSVKQQRQTAMAVNEKFIFQMRGIVTSRK